LLDNFSTQQITWNTANNRVYSPIKANSGDTNGRTLEVQILNGGTVEDLTGKSVNLAWRTKDGAFNGLDVFEAVDATKGIFKIKYTTGMLSNVGMLSASIVIIGTNERIESSSFVIIVERSNVNDASVQSENSFTSLTTALAEVQDIDNKFNNVNAQLARTEKQKQNVMNTQVRQNGRRRPLLSFIDDDATIGVYTREFPIVQELDFKFCSAVIPSLIETPGYMTEGQLREMHDTGNVEFLNHTQTHLLLANLSDEQQQLEVLNAAEWLQERGYTGNVVVYPGGSTNANVRSNMQKVARAAVTIDNGNHLLNTPEPLQTYTLQRVYIDYGFEVVKQKIDEAIATNSWIIVGMHVFYDTWNEQLFRDVVNYAKTVGIEIATVSEALDAVGNVLEVGDSVRVENQGTQIITAEGKTFGADLSKVVHRIGGVDGWTVTNDTPDSYFPKDKTTITAFLSSQNAGFPETGVATLITERYTIQDTGNWTYQEFRPSQSNKVYRRHWIVAGASWSAWDLLGTDFVRGLHGSITNTTPLSFYQTNKTTVTTVPVDAGFPAAGTVITHSYGSGFSYQTFKKHNSEVTYVRTWSSTTNDWTAFAKDQKGVWGFVSVTLNTIPLNSYKAVTVTITGLLLNDILVMNPNETIPAGLIYSVVVTAANTVQIRVFNTTGADVVFNAAWRYTILKSES